jgi:hypothetical protein
MDSWISVMPTFLINSFIVVRVFESKQKIVLVRDTSYFKPLPGPLADRIILPPEATYQDRHLLLLLVLSSHGND